jgi:hypothetical protein
LPVVQSLQRFMNPFLLHKKSNVKTL